MSEDLEPTSATTSVPPAGQSPTSDLPDAGLPGSKRGFRIRGAWINAAALILAAVLGAVVTGLFAIFLFMLANPSSSQFADVEAVDVLALDPTFDHDVKIGVSDLGVAVSGAVTKSGLPSGTQIWVLSRKVTDDSTDQGALLDSPVGVDSQGPCTVEPTTNRFQCDGVQLGGMGETGDYYVFVGLADSNVARQLVELVGYQLTGQGYEHSAPPKFKSLDAVKVTRG